MYALWINSDMKWGTLDSYACHWRDHLIIRGEWGNGWIVNIEGRSRELLTSLHFTSGNFKFHHLTYCTPKEDLQKYCSSRTIANKPQSQLVYKMLTERSNVKPCDFPLDALQCQDQIQLILSCWFSVLPMSATQLARWFASVVDPSTAREVWESKSYHSIFKHSHEVGQ